MSRWREDVSLLTDMGLSSYRFSMAWTRILPEGVGRVNQAGVVYYRQLIAALLERGIEPVVTLYHWDLPQVGDEYRIDHLPSMSCHQALEDRGGWLNPEVADWFEEYAGVCFREFPEVIRNCTNV